MTSTKRLTIILLTVLGSYSWAAPADDTAPNTAHSPTEDHPEKMAFIIPYPYYNQITDFSAGLVIGASGYVQPQVTTFINFIYSINDSKAVYFEADDLQVYHRLFLDTKLLVARWGAADLYLNRSNSSSKDDFITLQVDDQWYRFNFRYLLPIGNGKGHIINHYRVRGGILDPNTASGGSSWNPFKSGRTMIEVEPFYRHEDFEAIGTFVTSGITAGISYDNRDWPINPSTGSHTQVHYQRDWGTFKDSVSWEGVTGEFSKYWNVGTSDWFKQRVLAFDVWTVNILTWNDPAGVVDGQPTFHRPPPFAGDTLGGWDRFRGYKDNRFEDKAAIDYQLEYRLIPRWNPFPNLPLLDKLHIPWWQVANIWRAWTSRTRMVVARTAPLDALERRCWLARVCQRYFGARRFGRLGRGCGDTADC